MACEDVLVDVGDARAHDHRMHEIDVQLGRHPRPHPADGGSLLGREPVDVRDVAHGLDEHVSERSGRAV